nr:hypothetical protein [Tanacetum cinerariifolium]
AYASHQRNSFGDLEKLEFSAKNEGLDDIVSIPPGKEIDHLDAIPVSVQSLLNRANLIIFLITEFAGKLAPIDPIPPRIVKDDPEEDIRRIEKFDSLMEEIDIFLALDDSIPPGIKNDDYDLEGDILKKLLNNDSLSLPENKSFHFNYYYDPSSPRPLAKPLDDDGIYFDVKPDT